MNDINYVSTALPASCPSLRGTEHLHRAVLSALLPRAPPPLSLFLAVRKRRTARPWSLSLSRRSSSQRVHPIHKYGTRTHAAVSLSPSRLSLRRWYT